MTKTIKTLTISDAMMNEISGGRRLPVSKFTGVIEIKEQTLYVNILGRRCKGKKEIYASFIVTEDVDICMEEIHSGKVYEAIGVVSGERSSEQLIFAGLRYDDMDPITGQVVFEITDLELIRKMLTM